MKALTTTAGALIAVLLAGCGSTVPPRELRNARNAYQDASTAPGSSLAATDVYDAKRSLERAERSFADDGDSTETRDLAYIAERKAMIAKARGNTAISIQQKQVALADGEEFKRQQAMATREQLDQTKTQLDSERQARVAAEQRTADALAKMQGMTSKQDQRGLVLTLNGSVLFAFGKSELLPGSRKRLDDVVKAVKDDPRSITIVGHTDSVGSDETNMVLSQKRADAVRTYLVGHGITDDRVTTKGEGKADPIADNRTAEGRANNRRVEIILNGSADTTGKPLPKDTH